MKHYFKIMATVILFVAIIDQARAQSLWENIKIRKTFETKTNEDNKAAILSFTVPGKGSNSFLLNAGIGIDFKKTITNTFRNTFNGFFVFNRNTLVDKEQHNYKLGITANQVFIHNAHTSFFGINTFEYLHDYIDTTHSLVYTSYWHPVIKGGPVSIGGYSLTDHIFLLNVAPQAGFEYQNIIDANSSFKKGYDLRGFFSIGLNMIVKKKASFTTEQVKANRLAALLGDPANDNKQIANVKPGLQAGPTDAEKTIPKRFWPRLAELSFVYNGRYSLKNKDSNFDRYIPLFTAELTLYPLPDDNFTFGVSFNSGANPIDGTLDQKFWLFSLKFKK